jgi:hypothetical protein
MTKRAALLAKLEQKFVAKQLKTAILKHATVSDVPELQPAELETKQVLTRQVR